MAVGEFRLPVVAKSGISFDYKGYRWRGEAAHGDLGRAEVIGELVEGVRALENLRRLHRFITSDADPSAADVCEKLYEVLAMHGFHVP